MTRLQWAVQVPAVFLSLSCLCDFASAGPSKRPSQPFLINVDNETAIIGNDFWNVTVGRQYATKLFYKGVDLVGDAVGHYVSYSKCFFRLSKLGLCGI